MLGKIFKFLRPETPAPVGISAQPMVIQAANSRPDINEDLKRDAYRVDAIQRYIEQKAADNKEIPPERRREFRAEMHERTLRLVKHGLITPAQQDALLTLVGG